MAKKTQIQKFREAARAAGTDDSEERFNGTLKSLLTLSARQRPSKIRRWAKTVPAT
jgi:hypothetical protein